MERGHFAISAKLHVFARSPYQVFCKYMKINIKQAECPGAAERKYFKKLIVLPLSRLIKESVALFFRATKAHGCFLRSNPAVSEPV